MNRRAHFMRWTRWTNRTPGKVPPGYRRAWVRAITHRPGRKRRVM